PGAQRLARVAVARVRALTRDAGEPRRHAGRHLPQRATPGLRRADGRADRDGDRAARPGRPRGALALGRDLDDLLAAAPALKRLAGLLVRLAEREVEVVAVRMDVERLACQHCGRGLVHE